MSFSQEKLLDQSTGIMYTPIVSVWPLAILTEDESFFGGCIYLDSGQASSPVDYKLRVSTKVCYKKMVRCSEGHGLLQPENYHQIRLKIAEKAIESTELKLYLGGRRIDLKLEKSKEGHRIYSENMENEQSEKINRWKMLDKNLLKNLPNGVAECIKDGQRHNVRYRVFNVVYPLVLKILRELGEKATTTHLNSIDYFDISTETDDFMDLMMEYILFLLEKNSTEPTTATIGHK